MNWTHLTLTIVSLLELGRAWKIDDRLSFLTLGFFIISVLAFIFTDDRKEKK